MGRAVRGARILLLGLAYKKNTGDAREFPAVRVTQLLGAMGADLRAADPHVVVLQIPVGHADAAKLPGQAHPQVGQVQERLWPVATGAHVLV